MELGLTLILGLRGDQDECYNGSPQAHEIDTQTLLYKHGLLLITRGLLTILLSRG